MLQAIDQIGGARVEGITDAEVMTQRLVDRCDMDPERARKIALSEGFQENPYILLDARGKQVPPGWHNDF